MLRHKVLNCILSIFILVALVMPYSMASAQTGTIVVKVDSLNVRQGPSLAYPIIAKVKENETYDIISYKEDWLEIQLNNQTSGWVAGWLVEQVADTKKPNIEATNSVIISTVDDLRVRLGPGTTFQILGHLNKGDTATVLATNENWTKILFNNKEGWIFSEFTQNSITPVQSTHSNYTGTVIANLLNVRAEPSLDAKIVGKITANSTVTIVQQKDNWLQIQFSEQIAWIHRDFVKLSNEIEKNPTVPEPQQLQEQTNTPFIVKASILNVRDQGSLDGKIINKLKMGQTVSILQEKDSWAEIEWDTKQRGWVASWFLEESSSSPVETANTIDEEAFVTVLYNGTNIRKGPSTNNDVVARANEGETFSILDISGDWYKIMLPNKQPAFIAGWIVKANGGVKQIAKKGVEQYLANKTIVIDPGHGGRDDGTTGVRKTLEKEVTLRTAKLLYDKLKAAGANVVITRNSDTYVSLQSRVSTAHYHKADVFISLHFDSFQDPSTKGITSFYYNSNKDKALAQALHEQLIQKTGFADRGVRFGNYFVVRENKQAAVLLELGFLSNQAEEAAVKTSDFQEKATEAIFYGLVNYFK
ncbi:N-acetylmuramoyl-L-alanine amidase [Bacillus sp. HMF5848]|uniref:SH3 domain-containing protein n=1 Tax=Bacillus sp. HMF5848 TaxID=2495421 RepID=UPI000F768D54|nr:SH3 domain-containing protein [Bacillus sp. HMF5848]RSK27983.1 N-acetylmuramoyl-L-alanine amidase [Bacillus sp. HMF5848]